MRGDKSFKQNLFRVFKANKRIMLLGFVLGICSVFGAVLVSQVVGYEKKPINHVYEPAEIDSNRNGEENKEQNNIQADPYIDQNDNPVDDNSTNDNSTNDNVNKSIPDLKGTRFTVLLVGVDQRQGDLSIGNTDTLLVASINTSNGKVALLSIPRDTQVIMPGVGKTKINTAARVGKGLKTTTNLIEGLIGQPIEGYILTNFSGFKNIIDTLGGITLTVEKDMYYVTGEKDDGIINLKKGTQRLNGSQALQYARFRHDAFADISRTARQQAVLKAMAKEFFQIKTVPKLPWLIPQMFKTVETNLSFKELWSLANVLLRDQKPEISAQTLPGNFLMENDISYWKVDQADSYAVVKKLFDEGKTTSVFFK